MGKVTRLYFEVAFRHLLACLELCGLADKPAGFVRPTPPPLRFLGWEPDC